MPQPDFFDFREAFLLREISVTRDPIHSKNELRVPHEVSWAHIFKKIHIQTHHGENRSETSYVDSFHQRFALIVVVHLFAKGFCDRFLTEITL